MTPSRSVDDRSGRDHSRWFVTSNTVARDTARDSKLRVPPILSPTVQPATTRSHLHLSLAQTNRCDRATQSFSTLTTRLNPHSPRHSHGLISRRDFVPWRFSAAGQQSAWLDHRSRRLKT
jgi:hypothetical protein